MPSGKPFSFGISFGKFSGKGCGSFPVFFAVYAEIYPSAVRSFPARYINGKHLGEAGGQPGGLGTRGSCEEIMKLRRLKPVKDMIQPFKGIYVFRRFQHCPGKHGQSDQVYARPFKAFDILLKHLVIPLVRIIIAAE